MLDIRQFNVLIVDDHFLTRQIVADVMREMNVTRVTAVADGHAARTTLTEAFGGGTPFDVIFLDWDMPHLAGIDILQLFRSRPECSASAFIMLTSKSEHRDVLRAVNAGANGYLVKPVTKQAIDKKMKEVVSWVQKQRKA
jgi:CheY-like chemotaxis protein